MEPDYKTYKRLALKLEAINYHQIKKVFRVFSEGNPTAQDKEIMQRAKGRTVAIEQAVAALKGLMDECDE